MNCFGTVLIVDDDSNIRNTIKRILEKTGCSVETAGDGPRALEILHQQSIDLVFLDIHLPQLNGMEILRQIRTTNDQLPVIMLTGYGSVDSAVEALRLGAIDYLVKPFEPEALISRTARILRDKIINIRKAEIKSQIDQLQKELETLNSGTYDFDDQILVHNIQPSSEDRYITKGRLLLDLHTNQARFGGTLISIPPTTFEYLVVLVQQSPEVVDYQTLVSRVQHYDPGITEAREIAKWHIHVIRKALLAESLSDEKIINVRGVGYRMILE